MVIHSGFCQHHQRGYGSIRRLRLDPIMLFTMANGWVVISTTIFRSRLVFRLGMITVYIMTRLTCVPGNCLTFLHQLEPVSSLGCKLYCTVSIYARTFGFMGLNKTSPRSMMPAAARQFICLHLHSTSAHSSGTRNSCMGTETNAGNHPADHTTFGLPGRKEGGKWKVVEFCLP